MTLNIAVAQSDKLDKWSTRLAVLVAVYAVCALILQPSSFASLGGIYATKFLVSIPTLFIIGLGPMVVLFGGRTPTRYAIGVLRERWYTLGIVMAFFFVGLTAFSTYKTTIPSIVPYYADIWLADLDEWLHGAPSWKLAHRLDNETWSMVVFWCYDLIWFLQWFGTVLFVSLWSDRLGRIRYLWAHSLTLFAVGTVLAVALSSVGPIYYDHFVGEQRFYGLKAVIDELDHSYRVRENANYLLELYEAEQAGLGSGISAMPSVHVGLVVLNALFLSSLNRWAGFVGWAFAAIIFYGSVYTGWHYAVDGYVAAAAALLMWRLAGRLIHPAPYNCRHNNPRRA